MARICTAWYTPRSGVLSQSPCFIETAEWIELIFVTDATLGLSYTANLGISKNKGTSF